MRGYIFAVGEAGRLTFDASKNGEGVEESAVRIFGGRKFADSINL